MTTKQQRREIYWTAYCCLDGEECELTDLGLWNLISKITKVPICELRELWKLAPEWALLPPGSPGWPARKEILLRAIEMTY